MLQATTKPIVRRQQTEVLCQCRYCRDCFVVGVTLSGSGRKILKIEPNPKVIVQHGIKTHHICGGELSFFNL